MIHSEINQPAPGLFEGSSRGSEYTIAQMKGRFSLIIFRDADILGEEAHGDGEGHTSESQWDDR